MKESEKGEMTWEGGKVGRSFPFKIKYKSGREDLKEWWVKGRDVRSRITSRGISSGAEVKEEKTDVCFFSI
jgi:hypothetical protein